MAIPFTLTNKTLGKISALLSGQLRSIRRPASLHSSMANTIRVGAVQMTSTNDLDANYATCSRLVKEAAAAGVKFLCFPESFSFVSAKDGDSLKVSEPIDGPIMQKYCSLARCYGWIMKELHQRRNDLVSRDSEEAAQSSWNYIRELVDLLFQSPSFYLNEGTTGG